MPKAPLPNLRKILLALYKLDAELPTDQLGSGWHPTVKLALQVRAIIRQAIDLLRQEERTIQGGASGDPVRPGGSCALGGE